MNINPSLARARFIECAQAIGYLFDTVKGELANEIQDDIKTWYDQLAEPEEARQAVLSSVLANTENVWVKLYCAGLIRESAPNLARETLKDLSYLEGTVAVIAKVWKEAYLPDH